MLDLQRLHGIFPPILTPLTDDDEVDHLSLRRLVNYLLGQGVHGIWATGTTGEFPCFTRDERESIVRTVVETVRGRVPVIVGIGDASTRLAIEHGKAALRQGAQAVALTPPYYYVNSQEELVEHFRAVKNAVDLPLLVYNIPQTVKARMEVPTVLQLATDGVVVGVKDSQNDLDWFRQVMAGVTERRLTFRGFLGTRILIDAGRIVGAHGSIPGIANITAADCVAIYNAASGGDWATADRHTRRTMDVQRITNIARGSATSSSFSGMKAVLKSLGVLASARVRAPLRTVTSEEQARIDDATADFGFPVPG
ncbi:MAG TPA: dihydrodipicolinate synthase family protein [Chloroflexota bacterium]|nr:dihydrodipicolinate synthase family protein [Chloroflexota bacterium]